MSTTKIEWTDVTWNPVRGCTRVSEGCRNCYAERMAARFSGKPVYASWEEGERLEKQAGPFHGFAVMTDSGPRWTGRVELIADKLYEPLRWRKPRRVFVNSMSDLFHEALPDEDIDRVFQVMLDAPQHIYQVLTKRPRRMVDYMTGHTVGGKAFYDTPPGWIHLGVSAEDQPTADERIPLLLQTPAATRFVSLEPLLGAVRLPTCSGFPSCAITAPGHSDKPLCGIDWVIVGGESGPNARPAHPDWFRQVRDQCVAAGVPFFFKQFGEWCEWDQLPDDTARLIDAAGDGHYSGARRVGKRAAGRLLDGRTWDEVPR